MTVACNNGSSLCLCCLQLIFCRILSICFLFFVYHVPVRRFVCLFCSLIVLPHDYKRDRCVIRVPEFFTVMKSNVKNKKKKKKFKFRKSGRARGKIKKKKKRPEQKKKPRKLYPTFFFSVFKQPSYYSFIFDILSHTNGQVRLGYHHRTYNDLIDLTPISLNGSHRIKHYQKKPKTNL